MKYVLSPRTALVAGSVITIAACIWLVALGNPLFSALVICISGGTALTSFLTLGSDRVLEHLELWIRERPIRIAAVAGSIWTIYLFYSFGMASGSAGSAVVMALYLGAPFLLLWRSRGFIRGTWLDAAAILGLWLPLELGYIRQLLMTHAHNMDFHYAVAQGLALNAGIVAFAAWRRLPGIGYRFEFRRSTVVAGIKNFLIFTAIAIPLGIAIHFIRYAFTLQKLAIAPLTFIGIFLFTALPEEFLFRGLIQNCFERTVSGKNLSLILAAIVFGASHLNNGPPLPNYKYFVMASIAGVLYGRAWRQTGSLMASALTHALVDTAWSVIFR